LELPPRGILLRNRKMHSTLGCSFCERIKDGIIETNDVPIERELV
jgi:hypothetical protein